MIINRYSLFGMIKHVYNVKLSQLNAFLFTKWIFENVSSYVCRSLVPLFFSSIFYIFCCYREQNLSLALSFPFCFLNHTVLLVHLNSIYMRAGALGLQDVERIFSPLTVKDKSFEVSSRTLEEGSS